jgi:hypothetical protein
MSKDDRMSMALMFNPPPPSIPEIEEEEIILPPEEPKPIINPMIEKFKLSFYKIHGRYPTEEEISSSLGSLYKEDDDNNNNEIINININNDNDSDI